MWEMLFFFTSRGRHTRLRRDWSSDVCSSDLSEFEFHPRAFRAIGSAMLSAGALLLALTSAGAVRADPVPGYYDSVNASNAELLRASLHAVIDDHQRFPYTSTATDTWDILEQADENSGNTAEILDVYLDRKSKIGRAHVCTPFTS